MYYAIKATQKNKTKEPHKNAKHSLLDKIMPLMKFRSLPASTRSEHSVFTQPCALWECEMCWFSYFRMDGFCSCLQKIHNKIKRILLYFSTKFSETPLPVNPESSLIPLPSVPNSHPKAISNTLLI